MIEMVNQQLTVKGAINFDNAETVYKDGLRLIEQYSNFPLVVDLADLAHGNTLALAVLVQWLRKTPDAQGLHFKNIPEKMMKIIQSCHLTQDLKLI